MSKVFDVYYKRYDAWYDKNKFAYLSELEALKEVIPEEGKGLEIGVGTGRFAGPLNITIGLDCSKNMLDIAEKRGVNVRWGYAESLPFFENTFDYIAIIITICFVKDPQKMIEESWRVLKDKGKLIIGAIDKNSFLGQYYSKKKNVFYKNANFFNIAELARLLREKGFNGPEYRQTLFDLPDKIQSVQKPRKDFGKGGFVVITSEKRRI